MLQNMAQAPLAGKILGARCAKLSPDARAEETMSRVLGHNSDQGRKLSGAKRMRIDSRNRHCPPEWGQETGECHGKRGLPRPVGSAKSENFTGPHRKIE